MGGVDRTCSRAVGENIVARLLSLDLNPERDRGLSLARDLFIFSYSSERMTRIYLGNLDASLVDEVNRRLLNRLQTGAGRTKRKDRSRVFPVF